MSRSSCIRSLVAVAFLVTWMTLLILPSSSDAAPSKGQFVVDLEDPDSVMDVLSRLERSMVRNNDFEHPKRGVDFGLGRGYSGSQAAKHLMGLAAANYAIGPGRKRRSSAAETNQQAAAAAAPAVASPVLPAKSQ